MTPPRPAEALCRLGIAQLARGELAAALESLHGALQLAPDDPQANLAFAQLCIRLQQPALALDHLQRVLHRVPDSEAAQTAQARALAALGRAGDGLELLASLLDRNPRSELGWLTSGILREQLADYAGAADDYERALRVAPGSPTIRYHRAFLRLRDGDFAGGWADYEHRFDGGGVDRPRLRAPRWDGRPVERLEIIAEQGLGDVLHLARFVGLARDRAHHVTLRVPPSLAGLLGRSLAADVVAFDRPADAAPPDAAIELMSLPHRLELGALCVGTAADYLETDRRRAATLAAALPATAGRRRIGLAWAASSAHPTEASPYCRRSCPLEALAPWLERDDCRFVSLQVGPAARALSAWPRVVDGAAAIADFDDTAALVDALDLVVTVDTSLAHLAGSLGKPTLLLLPFSANWQWMHGATTPWYPTMRLFRQRAPGDWSAPVRDAIAAMER